MKAAEQCRTRGCNEEASDSSSVQLNTRRKPISDGKLAAASGQSIAMFATKAAKGMLVDIPLTLTDSLNQVPRVCGETVREHGSLTNFKTGPTVAAKTFVWGFVDGIDNVVVEPYQGARKEGVLGVAKGLGKGLVSITTNPGAGMFGLMA